MKPTISSIHATKRPVCAKNLFRDEVEIISFVASIQKHSSLFAESRQQVKVDNIWRDFDWVFHEKYLFLCFVPRIFSTLCKKLQNLYQTKESELVYLWGSRTIETIDFANAPQFCLGHRRPSLLCADRPAGYMHCGNF